MPSTSQNLQSFAGNCDVSKWVKISRVWRKTPNKQSKKLPLTIRNSFCLYIKVHVQFFNKNTLYVFWVLRGKLKTISSNNSCLLRNLKFFLWWNKSQVRNHFTKKRRPKKILKKNIQYHIYLFLLFSLRFLYPCLTKQFIIVTKKTIGILSGHRIKPRCPSYSIREI